MASSGAPASIAIDEARKLRNELARFSSTSKHENLEADLTARLRGQALGEPYQVADVLHIPPWQLTEQSRESVELTWTLDLGHESGTRRWLVAHVDRLPNGWKVSKINVAHAQALRRPN